MSGFAAIGSTAIGGGSSGPLVYGTASLALSGWGGALTASGIDLTTHGVAVLVSPKMQLALYSGAAAALVSPSPKLSVSGHNSFGENAMFVTSPKFTLGIYGGANIQAGLAIPTVAISATLTGLATINVSSPMPTATATGVVSGTAQSALSLSLGTVVGYSGAVVSVTIGVSTLAASGTTGSIGVAELTLPLFELGASGTAQGYGSANLIAPVMRPGATAQAWLTPPGFTLTVIGTATVALTYEAYALNLNHKPRGQGQEVNDELTRFTNYPFDKIIRYKNSYFGVNSTGLYLLEGTTDDAAPIAYHAKTKLTDFGTDQKKTPEAAVFGGRLGPDATVSVYTGESEDDVYAYTTPRGQDVQNYRQKFGKGLKARYYAFGIQGDGAMVLDTVSFDIAKLKRRI